MWYSYINSPIGLIEIGADSRYVLSIQLVAEAQQNTEENMWSVEAKNQLQQYFDKKRTQFELPLLVDGNQFTKDVMAALYQVGYGATISYGQLAKLSNHPKAYRAVGSVIHKNPYLIVYPCHRVIKADGSIGGFACGVEAKKSLLKLEKD